MALLSPAAAPAAPFNIVTYHYDNMRTGWNPNETILTPARVASHTFGLLGQVPLDEQVDAQPLFVAGQTIATQGAHDVVYVATENDTIYAIDADSGAVLLSQSYGTAVPISALPGQCGNNSNHIGINSTPVIDLAAGLLYAITYTYENQTPVFRLHAISLMTLQDTVPPVVVAATSRYKNGATAIFGAANNRQRAALLETGGNIYAGFGSWCDLNANLSRGWVLGWNAATLAPLPAAVLMNRNPTSQNSFFLSSIWMSGYGIASDDQGSLFFATGNSDYNGKTYNQTFNLEESVVRLSANLTTVQDFYTPGYGPGGWSGLDRYDLDLGSGGVLLLPDQPGRYPHLAIAAGKVGPMYLLNRDDLGGLEKIGPVTLGLYPNASCWCGTSYYVGQDNYAHIVASTGQNVTLRTLLTSASSEPRLFYEATSITFSNDQDPGFFTTISSNGTRKGTTVIWAVSRPSEKNADRVGVYLVALDPQKKLAVIHMSQAGTWPFLAGNANVVPVVAGGHVFVASYGNLSIYGLAIGTQKAASFIAGPRPTLGLQADVTHELYGTVTAITGDTITLRTRANALKRVDLGAARAAHHAAPTAVGQATLVRGDYIGGMLVARYVLHAKQNAGIWGPDR